MSDEEKQMMLMAAIALGFKHENNLLIGTLDQLCELCGQVALAAIEQTKD